MNKLVLAIAVLAAEAVSTYAAARDIAIEPGRAWTHKETGLSMAPAIDGFALKGVSDYGETQSDIALTYRDQDSGTLLSIYLFRAGVPDVSVWQDRIIALIRANQGRLGAIVGKETLPTSITPPRYAKDSGSIVTFHLTGGNAMNTGSAVLRMDGDWLMALRMSSHTLTEQQLSNRLLSVVASLSLPPLKNPERVEASYPVEPCADDAPSLPANRSAGGIEEATTAWMAYETQNAMAEHGFDSSSNVAAIPEFCREAFEGNNFSVYSRSGDRNGYLIALQDAGVTIEVSPPVTMWKTDKDLGYSVVMKTSTETTWYRGFQSMPTIGQVITVVNSEKPIAKVGRTPGTTDKVTIYTKEETEEAKAQ